jgi:hypothetical protein
MKKWLFFLSFVAVCLLIFFYFLYRSNLQKNETNTLLYNRISGEWEAVAEIPKVKLEEINKDPNEDGLHNLSIVRGYFDHYDEKTSELTLKSLLPFTMETQYELLSLKMPPSQTIYCSPSTIIDQVTGKELLTSSLTFMVKNEQTMVIGTEQNFSFDQFLNQATADTYLFIQLTQDLNKQNTNYIKKLIVIGLCD